MRMSRLLLPFALVVPLAVATGLAAQSQTDPKVDEVMKAARAALCCALAILGLMTRMAQTAPAAEKVIAGSLGGQAPPWAIYVAVHHGFFAA